MREVAEDRRGSDNATTVRAMLMRIEEEAQVIPDEAVEAAAKGLYERKQGPFVAWADTDKRTRGAFMGDARTALEAAAPHLMAVALRDAADDFHARLLDGTGNGRAYNSHQVAYLLRNRADSIEDQREGITHGND